MAEGCHLNGENNVALRECEIRPPQGTEVIVGQAFFSPLAVEELFRAIATAAPKAEFGVGMVEGSSGLVRKTGNSPPLAQHAAEEALTVGAGHFFIVMLRGAFPIQVVNAITLLPSVVTVFCATGNPLSLIVADTSNGSAILGVVDGLRATAIESEKDALGRRALVRHIGYVEPDNPVAP